MLELRCEMDIVDDFYQPIAWQPVEVGFLLTGMGNDEVMGR